jgi:hypothetical protein
MTTLLVAKNVTLERLAGKPLARGGLQGWLQGHWALLFSNPEDFAPPATTPPGFMACVAEELNRARTKALVVLDRLPQAGPASWLQQATGDRSLILLDCGALNEPVVELATRALLRKLLELERPYVLVLDEYGRCRSTITYRARRIDRPRTLGELLCVVAALRGDGLSSRGMRSPARAARVSP